MRFFVLLFVFSALGIVSAQAQPATGNPPVLNAFSIQGWDELQRLALLDRRGARFGYITDRGLFQRIVRGMTDEYDLNIFTYGFTPQQDFLWTRNDNGYRMYAGRQSDLSLALFSQFKTLALIQPRTKVGVRVFTEQDARSNRVFALMTLQQDLDKKNSIQFTHSLSEYQQDMDAGIAYQYGHAQTGFFKVEVTALDYLNNLKVKTINDALSGADTVRVYRRSPYLGNISLSTPAIGNWRAEFFGGLQLQSEAEIASATVRSRRFRIIEHANYHGAMLSWVKKSISAAAFYQYEFSKTRIDTLQPSILISQYFSEQFQRNAGAMFQLTSNEYVLESMLIHQVQKDVQQGQSFVASMTYQDSLRFRATRFLTRNRVMKRPFFKGIILGVEHTGDFRAPGRDAARMRFWSNSIHDLNQRFTIMGGWQFNPRAWIMYGYSFDLDRDFHIPNNDDPFDGGFIRMEFRW
jgi:hypothetical protein